MKATTFSRSRVKYVLCFLVLFFLFSALFTFYRFEEHAKQARSIDLIQVQLARRLEQTIISKAQILTVISNQIANQKILNEAIYHSIVEDYASQFPEFFALNWVHPKGTIQWVYPEERNKDAKNKDLLLRDDVRPYLEQSRNEKKFLMSHVVQLYQGPKGFVFYFPVYRGQFLGWLNGVFSYEKILSDFVIQQDFSNFNILIQNDNSPLSIYEQGSIAKDKAHIYKLNILNQNYEICIQPKNNLLGNFDNCMAIIIYLIALAICGALTRFAYLSSQQNLTLRRLCAKLRFSNSIVGILTHDFANQVTVVENNMQKLKADPHNAIFFDKMKKALDTQITTIRKAGEIRKRDFLETDFKFSKTSLVEQIQASIEIFEKQLADKNIKIQFKYDSAELFILTDPLYFQNNLLNNILSNAIKFSHPNSHIDIYTFRNAQEIVVEIRDFGLGISTLQLEQIKKQDGNVSTKGTLGEEGTGLGLIQVQTFVELLNGHMDIYSGNQEVEVGTLIILSFPAA